MAYLSSEFEASQPLSGDFSPPPSRQHYMDRMLHHRQERASLMRRANLIDNVQAASWVSFVVCIAPAILNNTLMSRARTAVCIASALTYGGAHVLKQTEQWGQQAAYHEGQFFKNQTMGMFDWDDCRIEEHD